MENQQGQEEAQVVNEIVIQVLSNGAIKVVYPEGRPELPPNELEQVTRYIYENLHDARIATRALEMFKARLG